MVHLGCLWFADLCWPAKKGGTATSVFCLIGLLERCADEVCQEGLWGQWATVRVHCRNEPTEAGTGGIACGIQVPSASFVFAELQELD
eukprot:scaffold35470_cov102-Skeletonema_marinoi.AAC.1